MGLNLATNQCLTATVSVSAPQPFTFMCWMQRAEGYFDHYESLLGIGDVSETLAFDNLQVGGSVTRAISFTPFAAASSEDTEYRVTDGEVHFLCGVFNGSSIVLYFDNLTPISQSWSPSASVTFDQLAIGRTVSDSATEFYNGTIEHAACWNVALNSTQVGTLYDLSVAPTSIDGLQFYFPFTSSLTDSVGTLSWSASNLGSPTYTSLGITYPSGGGGETGGAIVPIVIYNLMQQGFI